MLSKQYRLNKNKDFENVFTKGKSFFEEFLILRKRENELNKSRFAFVVSRKVSNKAVVRNKLKRRLREAVRSELFNIRPGCDVVFFTKKGIENKTFSEIKEMVKKLFEKARLLNKSKIDYLQIT